MAKKMGLWIDHRKAVIVEVTQQGEETQMILSHVVKQLRRTGDSPLKGSYEAQLVPADDSREAGLTGSLNMYYNEVITHMTDAGSIFIFGPGEAKGELEKRIEKSPLHGHIVGLETAGTMTDRQIAAKITAYFQKNTSTQAKPGSSK